MRVLLTAVGGAYPIAEKLASLPDFEVALVEPEYIDLGDWGTNRAREHTPVGYQLWPARVFPHRPYPYSLYLTGIASALLRFRPDVLYRLGEPTELSTAEVVGLTRLLSPRTRIVLFTWENIPRHFPGFPRCLRAWAQRFTLPRLDGVVAATHTAEAEMIRLGFDPGRIRVIYPGINAEQFTPCPDPALRRQLAPEGAFLVGYVGRLVQEKAVDTLLQAMALLPERFCLALAGSGRDEAMLRRMATDLGLGERVRWLGRVSRAEMPRTLSTFDTLVLPSRSLPSWQEQYGYVLGEAMLCETPPVGSSSGAIPEVIGEGGLVFPEDDTAALAACLRRLGDDPALCAEMGRWARRRALAEFAWDVSLRRLSEALREAAARPRR